MNGTGKSYLLGKLTVLFVICCCYLPAQAKYGGGSGSPEYPYLIYTAEQMNEIGLSENSNDWDKHFKLMADIDLSAYTGTSFNIIGERYYDAGWVINPLTGVFDGNDHTISNFTYTSPGTSYIGLFGYVTGEIKDLRLINPNVDAGTGGAIGSLVGWLSDGTISNCYVGSGCVSGYSPVGGLVGYNEGGTITNCYSTASVSGNETVGGLVGNNRGTITNCYATGSVIGIRWVGGLVGENNNGTITNCYSTGSVIGNRYVGGLLGYNYGEITNCYSTGSVSGNEYVGGIVGIGGTVIDSFWDTETSGQETSAGGKGKTTAEMQTASTFFAWGCDPVWTIDDGNDYPRLVWENIPGELITKPLYGGGRGEQNDPYLIYTSEQLNTIGLGPCHLDKHFKLMADIDLSAFTGAAFNIIGNSVAPFTGVFDGNGHIISNFSYSSTGTSKLGLFGIVSGVNAEIRNLGLIDPKIDAGTRDYVGSLIGYIDVGAISNCYTKGGSVEGVDYVGGMVGENRNGIITNCYSKADVSGDKYVGGLVGWNWGTITNCYSKGDVSGENQVGGLVGYNYWDGTITNCYSKADVSGNERVGGLVGDNTGFETISKSYATGSVMGNRYVGGLAGQNSSTITNSYSTGSVSGNEYVGGLAGRNSQTITDCYSTGSVSGDERVGGLVGHNAGYAITNCYATGRVEGVDNVGGLVGVNTRMVSASFWDIETSGQSTSAGGWGKTTAQMKTASTFYVWACLDDFAWTIDEGNDYPRLVWQNKPGELITIPPGLYGGGSGGPDDPYLIYTAEQLNTIGLIPCEWDKHFKLMADIDLSGFKGTSFNIIRRFTGIFDGNGHTISNFKWTSTDRNFIGLFGSVDIYSANADIKNLGLIDPNVDAGTGNYVGSLVGRVSGGTITNCYVEGGSVSGDDHVGGMVGENHVTITNCYSKADVSGNERVGGLVGENSGTITNCYSKGIVDGYEAVGGLVGYPYYGTITNCYATGSVEGVDNVGGLVGDLRKATITNCYATGSVSGYDNVGGLVGTNGWSDCLGVCSYKLGTITNCYSTGSVEGVENVGGLVGRNTFGIITNCCATGSIKGNSRVGGLVGYNYSGIINKCYSIGSVIGNSYIGGLVGGKSYGEVTDSFWDIETSGRLYSTGGTGLATEQMQMQITFTGDGWDFVGETFNGIEDIWFIPQQDYPHLWWEGMKVPMKLTPRTLNCRSEGNWVKAHLTLPQGFTVADVDSDRPAVLHSFGFESAPLYVFVNKDKLVEIEAAFERQAVCSLAGDWPEELTVAGFLTDGNIFLGTSSVRIIHPGLKVIEELAWYWLSADCVQPGWCDQIDMNRDSLVNLADYALLMNIEVEFVTDE